MPSAINSATPDLNNDKERDTINPADIRSEAAPVGVDRGVDASALTMAPLSQSPMASDIDDERIPESRGVIKRKRDKKFSPMLTAGGEIRHFVTHNYIDRSSLTPNVLGTEADFLFKNKKAGKNNIARKRQQNFPLKLHIMLHEVEKENLTTVVSWLPHGRAFAVHDIERFKTTVMGKYFQQSMITSFHRQLNLYDFVRITSGADRGAYYHEYFMRGKPRAIEYMSRTKVKGTKIRGSSSPEDEPNFYAMSPVNPPPYALSREHFQKDSCVDKNNIETSLKRNSYECHNTYQQPVLSSSLLIPQVSRSSSLDLQPGNLCLSQSSLQDGSCPSINNINMRNEIQFSKEYQYVKSVNHIANNIRRGQSAIQKSSSLQPAHGTSLTSPQTFNAPIVSTNSFVPLTPHSTQISLPSKASNTRGERNSDEFKGDLVLDNMVNSMYWKKASIESDLLATKFESWDADGDSLVGDADIYHDNDFVYSLNESPEEMLMEYTCEVLLKL